MDVYLAALKLDITKKSTYTSKDIKQAFKNQALRWHPDKNADNAERANRKMKEINEARVFLSKHLETHSSLDETSASVFNFPNKNEKCEREKDEKYEKDKNKKYNKYEKYEREERAEKYNAQQREEQKNKENQKREQKKVAEKDVAFYTECKSWTSKMVSIPSIVSSAEVNYLLTFKLIYVDLLRGCDDAIGTHVNLDALTKIAQIWYNYPANKGGSHSKFVHNFSNSYVNQFITISPEHAFYSREMVMQYLQQRLHIFLKKGASLTNIDKTELSLILAVIQ
jgi:curved DNA-binding protein CbpA